MKQTLLILISIFLWSSCATILNQSTKRLTITTTTPANVIVNNDTLSSYHDRTTITVKRQPENFGITVFNDSISKNITIKSKNSFAYWLNAYPSTFWTGFLIDKKKAKRYTYPSKIYVDMTDTINRYVNYDPRSKKGQLYLHLSIPHINSFLLKPNNENDYKFSTGFWGIAVGLDYYHKPRQFINLSASAVSSFFVPFPAAIDISGEYELLSSRYFSLSNNYKIKRFSVGYGLSYSRNTWDLRYYDAFDPPPPTREPVKKSNNSFGFIFPAYLQIGKNFNIGIIYRPTFLRPESEQVIKYEHLISIDFAWKIRLK